MGTEFISSGTSINDYNFHACILQLPILMSLLYHNDTIIKKEKELLRALLGQFCKLEVT